MLEDAYQAEIKEQIKYQIIQAFDRASLGYVLIILKCKNSQWVNHHLKKALKCNHYVSLVISNVEYIFKQ